MPPQKQEFFSQTDDSSLEPAGCVMQLAGKGGHGRGVHHDQCQPCLPSTRGRDGGVGMGRWRWGWSWSCLPQAGEHSPRRHSRADPTVGCVRIRAPRSQTLCPPRIPACQGGHAAIARAAFPQCAHSHCSRLVLGFAFKTNLISWLIWFCFFFFFNVAFFLYSPHP